MSGTFFHPLPLIQEELVVCYLGKIGHCILVNCLREACQGTVWLGNCCPNMTSAVYHGSGIGKFSDPNRSSQVVTSSKTFEKKIFELDVIRFANLAEAYACYVLK